MSVELAATRYPGSLEPSLVAPCGMDCGLCIAHLRKRKPCPGCRADDAGKSPSCVRCAIKLCGDRDDGARDFCFECSRYPCVRLRHLDTRYRTTYGMSMLENLEHIRDEGIEAFVAREKVRWECPGCGAVVSVHRAECVYCGRSRSGPEPLPGSEAARARP